jgi:hypothetical protein
MFPPKKGKQKVDAIKVDTNASWCIIVALCQAEL